MKTKIKIIILITFITFIAFIFIPVNAVKANSINKIDMDISIDEYGNAKIIEIWDTKLTKGTEGYRPYTNLGKSVVSNFTVSDETGKVYENIQSWNTSASFSSKAYKSGIHRITNGVELCWGISEYGKKTYTLKYDISNFVTQYTDNQGIYFNLINLDQPVLNAKITIHSDIKVFSLDNSRIWAFGNNGTIDFEDGNIVLESENGLTSSQYMVALVRFEDKIFNTKNISNKSFDDIFDSAMSDVDEKEKDTNEIIKTSKMNIILTFLSMTLFNPTLWIAIIIGINRKKIGKWISGSRKLSGYLDFGTTGRNLPSDKNVDYYREIPCNKDLIKAYWVSYYYNVVSVSTLKEGIIGAILLKWIKEGKIKVTETKKGLFSFKDNNYAIDFNNMENSNNEIENELLKILKTASGVNGILEAKEFEKWCKKNYSKIESWFSKLLSYEQNELENQGLITSVNEETAGIFETTKTITKKEVNPELYNEAINLKGLKKFLLDYSLMPEREYIEVQIWEEYLIFARIIRYCR